LKTEQWGVKKNRIVKQFEIAPQKKKIKRKKTS